jgi:GTP pyrophosphokinase
MTNKIKTAFELVYRLEPEKMRKFSPLPKGKEIYWTHLYSVYKLCVYWGNRDENILLSAILHDIVEDANYSLNKIRATFGGEVAEIVELCTKKKEYSNFKSEDQNEYFSRILNYKKTNIRKKVMIIKLADRLDNLMGATFIKDKVIAKKYLDETKKYYINIAKNIGKEKILEEAIKYAEKPLLRS